MKGVILAGGQSSRMGSDKGLMRLEEQNWAQSAADNFNQLNISFVVSVNNEQRDAYKKTFSQEQLILDNPNINVKGPLLGLLSVHEKMPNKDLFVLACDMVDMDILPLQFLLDKHVQIGNFDTYLFEINKDLEPVCAIYTAKALNTISNKLINGKLEKFSLKYCLKELNNYIVTPPKEWLGYFNNYNSPEDLVGQHK